MMGRLLLLACCVLSMGRGVAGGGCSERFVLNNTWGVITDGPGQYTEEAHCEWLIEDKLMPLCYVALEPGMVINLEFAEMNTECSYDQVLVYDGMSYEDRLLGAFSGDTLPHRLYALSGFMLVYFYSDYNYMKDGFKAFYSVTDCPFNCSGSNGNCDLPSHKCVCNTGYTGDSCQVEFCPGNCHGHGVCDSSLQRCVCDSHYSGYGCTLPLSPPSNLSLQSGARWFELMPADTGFTARTSHAGVFIDAHKSLFLFGGNTLHSVLDEFIKYDFTENRWVEIHKQLPWPTARHSHAMCEQDGRIFLFGGMLQNGDYSNELWVYNITANIWTDLTKQSGAIVTPTPVASHTLTVANGDVYLFGGRTAEGGFVSDMYKFSLSDPPDEVKWREVVPRGGLRALHRLAGHSATYHPESLSILVFGGFTPDTARFPARTNALYAFHVVEDYWAELWYDPSHLSPSLKLDDHIEPQLRALHGAVILGGHLVVYGGNSHIHHDQEVCYDNNIYFYHLGCHAWVNRTKIEAAFGPVTDSAPQSGRFSMVTVAAFGNMLLVSGGYRGNVLGDLKAYRVPVSVAKHQDAAGFTSQPTHCPLHTRYDHCKYDPECVWCMKRPGVATPGCVARSQKQLCSGVIREGYCQSICSTLSDCGSCTVQGQGVASKSAVSPGYWYNSPCVWCVKEAKCISSQPDPSIPPNVCERANATASEMVGWWGGRSRSLTDVSECRLYDYPAGLHYLGFNHPQDLKRPDQVLIIRESGSDVSPIRRKRSTDTRLHEFRVRVRGYIHPLGATHTKGVEHLRLMLAGASADSSLYVSTDEKEANKELVARLDVQTYDVRPANRSSGQPMFANESRGFKYYTEIQISKTDYKKASVSIAWAGAFNEDIVYRQKLTSEFLEPYNTGNCSHYDTCLGCMMDTACGWCELNRSCFHRLDTSAVCHRTEPTYAEVNLVTSAGQCATCEDRVGCAQCLQDSSCEWLRTDMSCTRRGRFHDAQTQISQCDAPCHRRTSCDTCIGVRDECVWCSATKTCFPFLEYISRYAYGGCNDWVDLSGNRTCRDCSRHSSAATCLKEFRCGWCGNTVNPTLGRCIEGDFLGPSSGVNCTSFVNSRLNVTGGAAWSYGKLPNVDECVLGMHDCHTNAYCINTYTSYECVCNRGYTGNGSEVCVRTCYDDCIHGTCSQAPLYECLCETGWTGPDCNTNCGCHNHSSCSKGQGQCDKCQDLTTGQFCELCVPGAYGNATTARGCVECDCNEHADPDRGSCDQETGQCFCRDNTRGDHCQHCEQGYYGNPRSGGKCYLHCEPRSVVAAVTQGSLGSYAGSGVSGVTSDVYCMWILTVHPSLTDTMQRPEEGTPTITFTMETSLHVACNQDPVYVYDGVPHQVSASSAYSSELLAAFCGSGLQQEVSVVARSGYLTVIFEGNRALDAGRTVGFNASYQVNSCPDHCHGNRSCGVDSDRCECMRDLDADDSVWFGGADCSQEICPRNCSDSGLCDKQAGVCRCDAGFGGVACEQSLQNLSSIVATLLTDPDRQQGGDLSGLPRMGHTLSACGQDSLYVFGGFSLERGALNDLWHLNLTSTIWRREATTRDGPSERYFHSIFCEPDSSRLYVYGGLSQISQPLSDIWMYDIDSGNWTKVQPTVAPGNSVPALAGHTMTYTGNGKAYLIGGFSSQNYFSSSTYVFDITTLDLSVLKTSGYPIIGVYGHSTVFHAATSALYVFGGHEFNLDSVSPSNHLRSLDLTSLRWSELPPQAGNQNTGTIVPEPRFFHSAVTTDQYMVVYGGRSSVDHVTGGVMVYRYDCNQWLILQDDTVATANHTKLFEIVIHPFSPLSGAPLAPTFSAGAAYVHPHMYLFGGMLSTTRGALYKVTFPADVCSLFHDIKACTSAHGCSVCVYKVTNHFVCHSQDLPPPHSCEETVASTRSCDRSVIQSRDCEDASSCAACLAQWPVNRGRGNTCKWCARCEPGKCIPVNSDCDTENPCSELQLSVNTSEACESLTCHAAHCERCGEMGDCVWTNKLKRKQGDSGFDFNEEGFSYTCLLREHLKKAPKAITHTCPGACTQHADCETCLASKGGEGGALECVWSGQLAQCLPLHSLPLYCAAGQCGHLLQGSRSLCPLPCSTYSRCDTCLSRPQCGWCTTEGANGRGICVEGGLGSPTSDKCYMDDWRKEFSIRGALVWAYLQCPLEDECGNDHHDCGDNEECIDLEEGFQCQCKHGYNRTDGPLCQPVCDQGCVHGTCESPGNCECDFGYVGENCSVSCLCNGHSNCQGVTTEMRRTCDECHNNTRGPQCSRCNPMFVGDPSNGGSCQSCLQFCNGHSEVCVSEEEYNKSQVASQVFRLAGDEGFGWVTEGPLEASSTVCVSCGNHSRGADCSLCEPGYFRPTSHKTEPCRKCECHGHSASCDPITGFCTDCQNNTRSNCNSDTDTDCWTKQCSACTESKYHGTPTDGHQCYLEMSVKTDYCYQSNTGNKCCFDPYACTTKPTVLKRGRTLFYAVQPQFVNVDIRVVLDVTVGGLDVYLSPFEDAWVVENDPVTWDHVISIDPKYQRNMEIETAATGDRSRRSSQGHQEVVYSQDIGETRNGGLHNTWTIPKPILLQGGKRGAAKVRREVVTETLSNSSNTVVKDSDFYDNQTIRLVETQAKGMFSFKSVAYNETLLIVRDVRNRLVIQLLNSEHQFAVSKFYMVLHGRGNPSSNDTYGSVFFRQDQPHIDLFVFFAVFFAAFFMKLAIIVLIWKMKQSYDAQRSRQQRQKEMRHMASRPFAKCSVIIDPPATFTAEDATDSADDSSTASLLQLNNVNPSGARAKHGAANSAFRAAKNRIGTLGGGGGRRGGEAHTINNMHPIALEAMDDGVAAVGTVLFQMPGGNQAQVGIAFGSSLITSRVFFPSLSHRSASIPRQGSTSV